MSTIVAFLVSWVVLGALVGWMFGGAARLGGEEESCGCADSRCGHGQMCPNKGTVLDGEAVLCQGCLVRLGGDDDDRG